jgi:hypothetical protein
MKQPVMNTPMSDEKVMGFARSMYKVTFAPEFMLRKLFSLRDADDFKYSLRAAQKVLGHIVDFNKRINYPAS